jgi:4-carboxymuconolactone decarboxylase
LIRFLEEIFTEKEHFLMADEELKKRTKETAAKLFGKGIQMEPPYMLWKEFDRDLANDFSTFITGTLYSRQVLSIADRQMVACAALAALCATEEFRLHANAALNVGCAPQKLAEAVFQIGVYAGMPAVNEALGVLREVLRERGEWQSK